MQPALGIHSQTHSLIHGTRPGTSAYHSPGCACVRLHVYVNECMHYDVAYIHSIGTSTLCDAWCAPPSSAPPQQRATQACASGGASGADGRVVDAA